MFPTIPLTPSQAAQKYEQFSRLTTIPHGIVLKLAIALGALLVTSVLIGFISMGIAMTRTSGFSETMLVPLILDSLILLTCLGLSLGSLLSKLAETTEHTPRRQTESWHSSEWVHGSW
jgi:hypothetical protein